jgi:hypothetical protein
MHLFPHINSSVPRTDHSTLHVPGRADIKSFGFDLGGTPCAGALRWDAK